MVITMSACGKGKTPDDSTNDIPKYETAAIAGWKDYMIICPDGAEPTISDAFVKLSDAIKAKYGSGLRVGTDFKLPIEEAPTDTLEILIGQTNRNESIAANEGLKYNDYVIKFENNRLIITGGSSTKTAEAVDFYIENFLSDEGLLYPTNEGIAVKGNYKVDKLTIGGVDISNFVIVRGTGMNSSERVLASFLQNQIADTCGIIIPYVMSSEPESEYEILLGNTGRAETSAELPEGTVSAIQTKNKIALFGNGENANAYIIKHFITNVLQAIPKGESYDISIEQLDKVKYTAPNLTATNLPIVLKDYKGAYDPDFTNSENVYTRFLATLAEFPDEISVLAPIEVADYPLSSTVLYVATDGNDSNPGTIDAPLATLQAAAKKLEGRNGGVIYVRGGTYASPTSINVSVSGTIISPVFIKAYEGETPVFVSGKNISPDDFTHPDYANDAVAQRIPEQAKSAVVVADLLALGFKEEELDAISSSGIPRLYINGKFQSIARYPNAGETELYFEHVFDTGSVTARDGSVLYDGWIKRVKSGEFEHRKSEYYTDKHGNTNIDHGWSIKMVDLTPCTWVNTGDIWYYGNVFSGWETGYYNVASFDLTKKALTSKTGSVYGAMHSTNSPTGHNNYYLFNAIEMIDAPGEWFIDKNTGKMYVYRTEDFDIAQIVYTYSNDNTLNLNYCENVVVDGISFTISGGDGICVTESNNVVIERCTVSNVDGSCINISTRSTECAVIYNDVSQSQGVMIRAYPQRNSLANQTPDKNIIQNNYCHDPRHRIEGGIYVTGCLSVISHNYLEDCRISLGSSSECIVEFNEIRGGSRDVYDAGLIYLNGYYNFGNHVRNNYLHDWNAPHSGIYFDDLASFNYAYYNILDASDSANSEPNNFMYISSGHYHVVYGNCFIGKPDARLMESCLYFDNSASLGYRFEGLSQTFVDTVSTYGSKVYKRFPELKPFLAKMTQHVQERAASGYKRNELEIYLRSPANSVIMNNLFLGAKEPISQEIYKKTNSVTGQKMTSTDIVKNNYIGENASFIFKDFANGDFSLLGTSMTEIKKVIPDYYPVSTENVGLTYER
jgi:hypothetical protein